MSFNLQLLALSSFISFEHFQKNQLGGKNYENCFNRN